MEPDEHVETDIADIELPHMNEDGCDDFPINIYDEMKKFVTRKKK